MFCDFCRRDYPGSACPVHGDTGDGRASIPPVQATALAGTVLGGRYVIRGLLGRGGMGSVYLAADAVTGSYVAVKLMEKAAAASESERKRVLQEARAVAMIDHPNVLKIYQTGTARDGTPFLAVELLVGESLGDLLRRQRILDEDIGVPIFRRVAAGLAAAHRAGVIHRDVKPDNLFLLGEPGAPAGAKVLDFGFAKISSSSESQQSLTASGVVVGTMDYLSPEQALTDPVDARSDVYGLGMVMYKAFTGGAPWKPKDDYDTIAHHLLVPAPPPSLGRKGMDKQLDLVIRRALRKDPANRYATMKEMVDDLDRVLGGRRGPLLAASPEPDVDVYVPTSRGARMASLYFYDRLGYPMPPWAEQ